MENQFADPALKTFGEPDSPWQLKVHEGIRVEASVTTGVMTIPMKWTQGVNWHVELIYGPFPVKAGQRYAIGFDACATQSLRFSVWLGQYFEPFDSVVTEKTHFGESYLKPNWEFFRHAWTVERDEPKARIDFALGRNDSTVRIRNPRLRLLNA